MPSVEEGLSKLEYLEYKQNYSIAPEKLMKLLMETKKKKYYSSWISILKLEALQLYAV